MSLSFALDDETACRVHIFVYEQGTECLVIFCRDYSPGTTCCRPRCQRDQVAWRNEAAHRFSDQ